MSNGDPTARSGIYQIRCLANGKVYIGSAINIWKRWQVHRANLSRGSHHSRHLQAAWQKLGPDQFIFEILQSVSDPGELVRTEQEWLDRVKPFDKRLGYNMSPTAGSTLGVEFSLERRAKIAAAHRGRPGHPNTIAAARLRMVEMNCDPEFQARRLAATAASNRDPELKEKRAAAQRGRPMHPSSSAAVIESNHRRKGEKRRCYGRIKPSRNQPILPFEDKPSE